MSEFQENGNMDKRLIFKEFLLMALGNIKRQKLRSILTISGIMIGIGALVAMLSFAAGIQNNISEHFEELDLFNTLHVLPSKMESTQEDTIVPPPLNQESLDRILEIPGIVSAVPRETYEAEFLLDSLKKRVSVQSLPANMLANRLPGELTAGSFYQNDSAYQVVVTEKLVTKLGVDKDSLLGKTFTLKTTSSTEIMKALVENRLHQLSIPDEFQTTILSIMDRVTNATIRNNAELEIVGIFKINNTMGVDVKDVIIPTIISSELDHISFSDPSSLMSLLSKPDSGSWSLIEVVVDRKYQISEIRDQIEEFGFRTFSFAEEFDQIKKSFLIFDLMVATLAFIAIFVASLGIVNTMIMSIVERTREIGILKSLGGEEGHIRLLFQVESIMIGLLGSITGIGLGWGVSRLLSLILKLYLRSEDNPEVEAFMLTPTIVLIALGFGVTVSFLAGLYPAARASRINAVEALRHE